MANPTHELVPGKERDEQSEYAISPKRSVSYDDTRTNHTLTDQHFHLSSYTVFDSDPHNVVNIVNLKTQMHGTKDKLVLDLDTFKDKILNDTVPVAVSGVMMVGLPCSGKSTIISEALKKKVKLKIDNSDEHVTNHMLRTQEDKGLTMYELCVLGDKQLNQYAWSFTSGRSGITYATISCIIREMKNNLLGVDKVGFEKSRDQLLFDEKDLNAHLQWIFAKAEKQFVKIKVEREKIELLSCGLSLVNIFDVGVNKAVYDFLPYLAHSCRHLTRLVAFSVERDAPNFFTPPSLIVEKSYHERHDASLVMQWRERMSYLLHFASLGHYSAITAENRGIPYRSDTSGRTFFLGVHPAETEQEFSDDFKRAKKEILKQTKSKNMCWITEEKYWLEIKDTKNLEHAEFIRRLISKSAEFQTQMPLKWLFLRSMVATACATDSREGKILTIEKKNLFRYAKALNMDENDFEEFITFFSSYGSIVPVECLEKKNDYIIVNVFEFTRKLSKIYYPEERNAHYTQHEKYGIVEHINLRNEVLRDYPGNLDHFIEIVIQFGMVAKIENVVNDDKKEISGSYYYIPSARIKQSRAKSEAKTDSAYIVIESVNLPANVQARLAHSISNIESIKMHMVFTECSNVTTFQFSIGQSASKAQLELVYRGKETELRIINFDDLTDDIKEDLESHLKDVLLACCKTLNDESQQFRHLLYNIGFQCKKKREIHYYYSDNNSDSDMYDCSKLADSQSQIAVWKHAIEKCEEFKRKGENRLNHEDKLNIKDFSVIADELNEKDLGPLIEKLQLEAKPESYSKDGWRRVYDILMEWEREQEKVNKNPSKQKLIKIFESLGFKSLAMRLNS